MNWTNFPLFLGLILITLKLCGLIDISWWWVTMPLWIGFAVILSLLFIIPGFCWVGYTAINWIKGLSNVFKK